MDVKAGAITKETPYGVLFISGSDKAEKALRTVLPKERFDPIVTVGSAEGARAKLSKGGFALAVINAPLPDALGPELARELAEDVAVGVLLLVAEADYPETLAALVGSGALTLSRPVNPLLVRQGLELLLTTRARLSALERKAQKLAIKMEDIRIINRAKWVLIGQLNMDEAAAHHYIEKQAMNQHRSRREVAQSILMTYEAY